MQLYRSPSAEPAQAVPAEVPGELCESLRQRIQDFYGPSESTLETKRWLDTFTSDARVVIGSDFSADGIEELRDIRIAMSDTMDARGHHITGIFAGVTSQDKVETMLYGTVDKLLPDRSRVVKLSWAGRATWERRWEQRERARGRRGEQEVVDVHDKKHWKISYYRVWMDEVNSLEERGGDMEEGEMEEEEMEEGEMLDEEQETQGEQQQRQQDRDME